MLRLSCQKGNDVWTMNHFPRSCSGDGGWKVEESEEGRAESVEGRRTNGAVMVVSFCERNLKNWHNSAEFVLSLTKDWLLRLSGIVSLVVLL